MAEQTNPSGCRHCGIDKHGHLSQWAPHPVGWHTWVEPTMEQRKAAIKANLGRFTGKKLDRTEQEPKPEPAGFCCGCCDDEPEPDWADLREMARNAGWTRRTLARDWSVWMNGETSAHIRRRWPDGWKVTLAGDFGELALNEPTPARFFAVAREMGLGGGNDPR